MKQIPNIVVGVRSSHVHGQVGPEARKILISLTILLLVLMGSPVSAQADPYAPGRALIADIGKVVTPDGVQETFEVTLGGTRQVVNVRGADRNNPILLFIHGGPGAVEMPIAWSFQRPWEDYFTVVQWDQRGAGRSYALNDPATVAPTLTPERYRDDAIELIDQLRSRYAKRKIILLGHSWGSLVGMMVAAKRPDLLHAYVGMGQLIDFRKNERAGMDWTMSEARRRKDDVAYKEVESLAPYPETGPIRIEAADNWRKHAIRYGAFAAGRSDGNFYLRAARLSPEYGPADLKAWESGSLFTVKTLMPRLADASVATVRKLDVPVFMMLGRHDYMTPSAAADAWMQTLKAPKKKTIWFEHSAHLPMIEEPGRVFMSLVNDVRPLARNDKQKNAK